jgi:outer membrane lipoprotein-sorting protein
MIKTLLLLVLDILSIFSVGAQNPTATEIVEKADNLLHGECSYAEMEMQIIRPSWSRILRFNAWTKGDDYSLIYITFPQREKGQRFLKRSREMWNYVPAIDQMIKIPPGMMMQSWMGSDLTNNDLVNAASIVKDYDHKILRKETLRDRECYVIEMIPHKEAQVVWRKVITWISTTDFLNLRNEYYDEAYKLVNEEILDEIEDVGDRTIPTRYTVIPANEEGHQTIIKFEKINIGAEIEESFFSIQNMKRMR